MFKVDAATVLGFGAFGLIGIMACQEESKDTSDVQDTSATTETQSRVRAAEILATLTENVRLDMPSSINQGEEVVTTLQQGVLQEWKNAFLSLDAQSFEQLLLPGASLPGFHAVLGSPERTIDGVSEFSLPLTGAVDTQRMLVEYLGAFQNIEHISLDVHEASTEGNRATLKIWYDMRGIGKDDSLRQDRGWMDVQFQKDSQWKISSIRMVEQEVLTAQGNSFVDATQSSGLSTVPLFPRLEALRRGGYAITVGDFDNDKDADIYVGGWGASNLYENDGTGNFTDVTAAAKIGNVDRVKAAAFTDLDNDGDVDLVLSRFIDEKSEDLLVFTNNNGQFTMLEGAVSKALNYDRAMPLTVADFNRDGFNDIYVGFPGARDFTYLDAKPNPLNTQGVFMNNGNATFRDATLISGLDKSPGERTGLAAYPHASVKADFDGDGRVDLMVADDRRGPSHVYKHAGDGTFSEVSSDSGLENKAWAMGVAVGDYDNDGLPDIYYSNIDFLAAKRIDASLRDSDVEVFHGNRLYRNLGDGTFEDVTEKAGVGWAGEAAAGSMWMDYDNDGDLDLYVLNGLWTGPGDQELSSLFNRAYVSELLIEKNDLARAKAPLDIDAISLRNPGFNNMIIQTLTHFSGDLMEPLAESQTEIPSLSLGGNQRNVLFRNNGDGSFTELGYLAGVDTIDDGYMPAFADVDKDGKLDLLVRNCDPGTQQYQYPSLRLYKNQSQNDNSLAIRLQGNQSPRDAVGAKVTIRIGESIQVREIDTVSGAAQSEMMAFFGLGEATSVDEVTIHWPSGQVDRHQNIRKGEIAFEEGR
ncbi:MAG: CRTAC1 family protein [Myxococcota bacterium]|nr:CRTAC1 family protein [Myxococcota bacterium]